MNNPDYNNQHDQEDQAQAQENRAQEQTQQPQNEAPQWYGVTYQNGTYLPPITFDAPKKSGKKRTVAIVALCLTVAILIAAISGVGGYLFAKSFDESDLRLPSSSPTGGNGTGVEGEVYPSEGNEGYEYTDVSIPKNDGSSLTDWKKGSAGDNAMSRVEATAAVKDSVVEIMTETHSYRGTITAGAGSGVIIHADGVIVTNHHVIDGATNVYVRLTNGNTYEATVRGSDEEGDIAVIKIHPQETLTVARLGCSAALTLNEDVFAIGNPLGMLGGTVTNGYISALDRQVNVDGVTMTLIQTDAAVNSGNSGGGLFNLAGELIGVVNSKYAAEGVEGLAFAIPIDSAYVSINYLLEKGYIPGVPAIGAAFMEKHAQIGYSWVNMPWVSSLSAPSDLQEGDYIYAVGNTVIATAYGSGNSSLDALKRAIRAYEVGDTVTLKVYRTGQQTAIDVQVTLVEYIPENATVDFE